MKRLIVELPDHEYENIITLAAVNIGRGGRFPYKGIVMYALNAIRRAEIIDDKAADEEATTKNDLGVDYTSREEAYKTIKENLCAMCAYGFQCMESCDIRSCDNRDAMKVLEQESRWIPVSERMPEKNMRCLVAVGQFNFTEIATYSDLMGIIDHKIFYQGDVGHDSFKNITQYVKAWMPLPKPYEGRSEHEKDEA